MDYDTNQGMEQGGGDQGGRLRWGIASPKDQDMDQAMDSHMGTDTGKDTDQVIDQDMN